MGAPRIEIYDQKIFNFFAQTVKIFTFFVIENLGLDLRDGYLTELTRGPLELVQHCLL